MRCRLGRLEGTEMSKLMRAIKEKDETHAQIEDEMGRLASMNASLKSMMAQSEVVDIVTRPSTGNVKMLTERAEKAGTVRLNAKRVQMEIMHELYPTEEGGMIRGFLPREIRPYWLMS